MITKESLQRKVYERIAAQKEVNRTAGAQALVERDKALRDATSYTPGVSLVGDLGGVTPDHPEIFHRIMSASVGEFMSDQSAMDHRISPAKPAQYMVGETLNGLKDQWGTREGIGELIRLGFFTTLAYGSACM